MLYVKSYTKELLSEYIGIDEILTAEDAPGFSDKYRLFKSKNPDLIINVKPDYELALIFFLLRTRFRIGTGYRWFSFLYNYKVYEHRKTSDKHESDLNLNLIRTFFDQAGSDKNFFFRYGSEEKTRLIEKLKEFNFNPEDKFIIIHPGSGGSAKDLPIEKFPELINIFFEEYGDFRIVITGLESESALAQKIINNSDEKYKKRIINLTGKLTLRELLILTDHTDLFISNSTGPIHIAGALNKSIIGFYPNEKHLSEVRWGPLGNKNIIIKPDEDSDDMSEIRTDEIMQAVKKLLK